MNAMHVPAGDALQSRAPGKVHNEFTGTAELVVQAGAINGDLNLMLHVAEMIETGLLGPEALSQLRTVFVPPLDYFDFVDGVRKSRVGAVVAESGTGRWTTAVMTLAEVGFPVNHVAFDEGDEDWSLARLPCGKRQGYLLDLSEYGPLTDQHRRTLRGYAQKIRDCDSVVVFIAKPEQWPHEEILDAQVFSLKPPRSFQVFERHLQARITDVEVQRWREQTDVSAVLDAVGPADAARLARLASEVWEQSGGDPQKWIGDTLAAFGDWKNELKSWFAKRTDEQGVHDRVLITAIALLENEVAGEVLIAAEQLAESLQVPPADPTGISGPGLEETLKRVDATAGDDLRVRFPRVAYGEAVLEYLWRNHPRVRTSLLEWSADLAKGRSPVRRRDLAARWVRFAIRNRDPEPLVRLFEEWSGTPQTQAEAIGIAALAVMDRQLGRGMRSRLYALAQNPGTTTRAIAVAAVCAEYGRAYPGNAMTRLQWLADMDDDDVREAVLSAVRRLAEDPTSQSDVMSRLVAWVGDERGRGRVRTARRAMSRVLASRNESGVPLLLDDHSALEPVLLAKAWQSVLDVDHRELAAPAVAAWLEAVVRDRTDARKVADILATATYGDLSRTVAAIGFIVEWQRGIGAVDARVTEIQQRILSGDPLRKPQGEH
ncbi:hypothetical protein ACQEU5_14265 [Marinactinospora thermotolerans]|uniref:Uncharacterized protein n=1 Tax=Marinactinospora thermotolerans DSM 45154 TaxID=1122192 RepID=A0A1T4RTV3_9ACTN|nr:hypothetical protein [Marinactinospora thermotolerans]SKA19188.1 hypothetical protein SAMN02745673_02963 [Marinactinospora thermotolerans DSM 45154]